MSERPPRAAGTESVVPPERIPPTNATMAAPDAVRDAGRVGQLLAGGSPPAAGWYRDPSTCHGLRWWDGRLWSDLTADPPGWQKASDGQWYPPPPPPPLPPPPLARSSLESSATRRAQNSGAASLSLGIIGVVLGWIPVFGLLFAWLGPISIWTGARAMRLAKSAEPTAVQSIKSTATWGIVTGTITTCFLVLWGAFWLVSLIHGQDPFKGL